MTLDLHGAVVVVTGASSGIGRATALEFAERGSRLVLAARRADALEALARECEQRSAQAIAVPTDVADEEAVNGLAQKALEAYGVLDVWVNNAAVSVFGRAEETPSHAIRRLLEVNFLGCVWGARAALRQFRRQGRGVLINTASMLGKGGAPYASYYAASKHALLGYAQSLRMELLDDKDIHVCSVMPASIDTPLFQQSANYTGRAAKALNPVYEAEQVAQAIVACVRKPQAEVFVGNAARLAASQRAMSTTLYELQLARQYEQDQFQDVPAPPTDGNLYQPMPEYAAVSGGWLDRPGQVSGRSVNRVAIAGASVLAAALAGLWWARSRRA